MAYPTLEQYNAALQHPAFALADPMFKSATIAKNGLGLPVALCGGFALTYTVSASGRKYAVRCFHKQSNALEARYDAISQRLRALNSAYFVDFEFQPRGVRVDGNAFPIVKMAWAAGVTLGEFLERHHTNRTALDDLRTSLMKLAQYLESESIAHGDVQPGNVMVGNDGRSIKLIDYDGMYVTELEKVGSSELGLRSFQHPKRDKTCWDPNLDRFSFIVLVVALQALAAKPALWDTYQADETSVLFRANDLAQPRQSAVFQELRTMPKLAAAVGDLVAVCESPFAMTPSLVDFVAHRNIPKAAPLGPVVVAPSRATYLAAFPVVPAKDYEACFAHVGDRVELIGRVTEVRRGTTKYGKPYVFVNFGYWKSDIVKLNIWSEGLIVLTSVPNDTWVGKWVSVVGLIEPPYHSPRFGTSHLAISINQSGQIHMLTEKEAAFRLAGSLAPSGDRSAVAANNSQVLDAVMSREPRSASTMTRSRSTPATRRSTPSAALTRNQAVLQNMKGAPTPPASAYGQLPTSSSSYRSSPKSSGIGCGAMALVIALASAMIPMVGYLLM